MDALAFLAKTPAKLGPLYVLHGDEAFLKRQCLRRLRDVALGDSADDSAVSNLPGDKATFADVFDELETLPFFGPRRVVIVDGADPFVTKFRTQLEDKLQKLPASGLLVLDVKTWMATTRLAKSLAESATLTCKAPTSYKAPQWCSEWSQRMYQKTLPAPAANLLVDLVGAELGLLDQELLKLSLYVGARASIERADVDKLVGNQRTESIWQIFDAIGAGDAKRALEILANLFEMGEEPMRILGAMSSHLRKLGQAARYASGGAGLASALQRAGIAPFGLKGAELQMRHLGRQRAERIYDMLLKLNMDLRGESQLGEQALFERFVLDLARKLPG